MKASFVEQGASRYVVGDVTPFDQKTVRIVRIASGPALLTSRPGSYMTRSDGVFETFPG